MRAQIRERDFAFKAGTLLVYREAQKRLRKGIREAKRKHKLRMVEHFNTSNSRNMWQGIKTLTGYKTSRAAPNPMDSSLPNTLNQFFVQFDQAPSTPGQSCPEKTQHQEGSRT